MFKLIPIIFAASTLSAQVTVDLSGQVKDAQTKETLEFCPISVYNTKDSMVAGTVTDNKGFFTSDNSGTLL